MEDEIMKKLKLKIAISKMKEESEIAMNRRKILMSKRIGMVACACIMLITGIVYAKDIENYFKNLFNNSNEAIDVAVENGYVQKEEMDFAYDNDIGVKVDSLVLDDLNLDVSFKFEIKQENVKSIRLNNFIITNDNEKVVYRSEFQYAETLDELPLYNSVSWINEPVKLTDTTFTDSILFGLRPEKEDFQKLYFDVKSVDIIYEDDRKEVIDGEWKFNVTINDEMRKSTNVVYTLAESNEYVESCTGTLSATGLEVEFNLRISLDPMQYVMDNFENINDTGLFYLKNNSALNAATNIELNNTYTQYTMRYDTIGIFSDNPKSIEIYLEPFDYTIVLIKEEN